MEIFNKLLWLLNKSTLFELCVLHKHNLFVCDKQQKNKTAGSTKLPQQEQLFHCPPVVRALSAHTLLVHVIQFYSTFDQLPLFTMN